MEAPDSFSVGPLTGRRPTPGDAPALHDSVVASLDHLRPWMPWAVDGYSLGMAEEFLRHGPGTNYLLWDDDALVGACGLHDRLGPGALEIGYWIDVRHTGRGHATRAAAGLTHLALGLPGVAAVEIHHDEANHRSAAVPARLGFERFATAPQEPEAPAETGVEWRWRMTADAWPASPGARLVA